MKQTVVCPKCGPFHYMNKVDVAGFNLFYNPGANPIKIFPENMIVYCCPRCKHIQFVPDK